MGETTLSNSLPCITIGQTCYTCMRLQIWSGMRRSIVELVVLGAVCSLAVFASTVGQTSAETQQTKESVPVAAAVKPAEQQSKQGQSPLIQRAKKSPIRTVTERPPEAIQKQAKSVSTEIKSTSPKSQRSPRRMKVYKKRAPKAVVQPRTDLIYHGMLESPQRYDPRRNRLGGGVPDPHTAELTHDHFQELDRNQDGSIDPVERTFGRPDMDRDLHDRQTR